MKSKNITPLHRLSRADEDSIYALVLLKITETPNDNLATRKDKEIRRNQFAMFRKKITPIYRGTPRAKGPMRLCYEHIPELLDISGLSYLDVFNAIAKDQSGNPIEPKWSSETEDQMCSYCDMLSKAQRASIKDLIRSFLPSTFEDLDKQELSAVQKIVNANNMRTYCSNETSRQVEELGIVKQYRRRNVPYSHNAIEFNLLPYMAEQFDVSIHWLLGLDESRCVFASNGDTETIMTLFCFLPDERKSVVLKAVETAIANGGIL